MKKKKKKPIQLKVCNRCKKKQPLNAFNMRNRERLSGRYVWTHPWCKTCLNAVKELWGFNFKEGMKRAKNSEKETSVAVQRIFRFSTNKTGYIKRTNRGLSKYNTTRRKVIPRNVNRSTGSKSTGKSRSIISNLRKNKDYTGE